MKKHILTTLLTAASLTVVGCSGADTEETTTEQEDIAVEDESANEDAVQVGGADMFASKNIIENAVNSPIHTTLVAAVKAADLVDTLSGEGPFTVFAPVDDAFAALPDGTVETLLKPENKDQLSKILTYHVVAGNVSAASLIELIEAGNGTAVVDTVAGETLTATLEDGKVKLAGKSGTATVTQADVFQSNGVIHVIDGVILPE